MEVEFKLSCRLAWLADILLIFLGLIVFWLVALIFMHFNLPFFSIWAKSLEIGERLRGFFVCGEPISLRSNPSSVVVRSGAFLVARLANGHPPGLLVPDLSGCPKQRTFLYYGVYSSKQTVTAVKFEPNFLPQAYIFLA